MTLLAPLYFYCALGIAAVVIGLHCIVSRQPDSTPFPTVRFVPRGSVSVTTLARPEDPGLLLLRAAAVILIGLALAHPVLSAGRRPRLRVVLLDRSRATADVTAARDSARAWLGSGDVLIEFDSAATVLEAGSAGSGTPDTHARGRLSSALIAALRTASRLRTTADSLELVIVSPLLNEEMDGATPALRALWPGRITLVPMLPVRDSVGGWGVELKAPLEDGVGIAVSLAGLLRTAGTVRLLRQPMTRGDSLWATQAGHTLVRWDSVPGVEWERIETPDTMTAVVAGENAVVYPLARHWRARPRPGSRVVARWVDGAPAAIERAMGAGCIREVAVPVPTEGDLVLRYTFRRLVSALVAPCLSRPDGPALTSADRAELAGAGPLARGRDFPVEQAAVIRPVVWLLLLAAALLGLEQWGRRRAGSLPAATITNEA
jgi:hypothetical protein